MYYIYVIQNIKDLKVYVGQSKYPYARWYAHKNNAREVQNGYKKKYQHIDITMANEGIDNFTFSIIEKWKTLNEINLEEDFWIDFFQSLNKNFGYNKRKGGYNSGGKYTAAFYKVPQNIRDDVVNKYLTGKFKITDLVKIYSDYKLLWIDIKRILISSGKVDNIRKNWNKKFSKEQEQEICDKYINQKIRVKQLCYEYNCSAKTIYKTFKRMNIKTFGNSFYIKGISFKPTVGFKKGHKPYNKIFNNQQEIEICNKYIKEDLTVGELSRIYNQSVTVISTLLDRNKIKKRKRGFSSKKRKAIYNMYLKLGTFKDVAEQFSISRVTVSLICKEFQQQS